MGRQPLLRAGFPLRTSALAPAVREGLRFGLRHQALVLEDGGLRGLVDPSSVEPGLAALLGSAGFVGRWLAKSKEPATAFALLGVTV